MCVMKTIFHSFESLISSNLKTLKDSTVGMFSSFTEKTTQRAESDAEK